MCVQEPSLSLTRVCAARSTNGRLPPRITFAMSLSSGWRSNETTVSLSDQDAGQLPSRYLRLAEPQHRAKAKVDKVMAGHAVAPCRKARRSIGLEGMGAPKRAIVLLDAQNFHAAPFFDIDLRIEREGGAFWLRLNRT